MVFLLMAVGYIMGKLKWMTSAEKKFVSRYVVNIAVPFNCIAGLVNNLDRDSLGQAGQLILSAFLGIGITLALGALAATVLKLPRKRWGVFASMAGTSNTLFIGLPMSTQLLGDVSVPYVMFYWMASSCLTQTLVVLLIERAGTDEPKGFSLTGLAKDLLTKPPILGILVGLLILLLDFQPPALFMKFADYMSKAVTPMALLYCGYIVYEVGLKNLRFLPGIPTMLVIRLIISPMICIGMCVLMGITGLARDVFVVESALPVVTMITVLAGAYGADEEYAAVGSCLSTLGCFITIPILMVLLGG